MNICQKRLDEIRLTELPSYGDAGLKITIADVVPCTSEPIYASTPCCCEGRCAGPGRSSMAHQDLISTTINGSTFKAGARSKSSWASNCPITRSGHPVHDGGIHKGQG